MLILGEFGHAGVDIFFVISGFVIAFTSRGRFLAWSGVPHFMLRRLARLAPPYWLSILLTLSVLYLQAVAGSGPHRAGAGFSLLAAKAPVVVADLFYLQDLLRLDPINVVYWTLCIEVQFYLVYAMGTAFWHQRRAAKEIHVLPATVLLLLSWLVSLLLACSGEMKAMPGTFLPYWHEFALGILACRLFGGSHRGTQGGKVAAVVLAIGLAGVLFEKSTGLLVALLTFGLISFCGKKGWLYTALDLRPLQFLGRISYSAYLVHVPVGFIFLGLKNHFFRDSLVVDFAAFLCAVFCTLLLAEIFYQVAERPAMRLSQRFRPS